VNETESNGQNETGPLSVATNDLSVSAARSNEPKKAERRRRILDDMKVARRGRLDERPGSTSTMLGTPEMPSPDRIERDEPIEPTIELTPESAASQSNTTAVATAAVDETPGRIEELMRLQENAMRVIADNAKATNERISGLAQMSQEHATFAEALTEALKRSSRQIEDAALNIKRTEYLLGHVDETCRQLHSHLSRTEILIENAGGMLSAGRRELQSEAILISRYIARKLRFVPLLILLTTLLFAVSAVTWWSLASRREAPTIGTR
jgi:hypothetical protein